MPRVRGIIRVLGFVKLNIQQQLLTYIIFYEGSCKHDKLYMNGADISSLLYINFNTFKIKLEKKDSLPATLLY